MSWCATAKGTIVASAPKAEVGLAGSGLLTGNVRPDRLSLIGAALSLRIDAGRQCRHPHRRRHPAATTPVTGSVAVASTANASERNRAAASAVQVTTDPLAALPHLDRQARLARPRRRLARRDRPEGRHAGRGRSARRQALDLRAHQSEPDAAARRRRRLRDQLDRRRRPVVAHRHGDAKGRRPAHHRAVDAATCRPRTCCWRYARTTRILPRTRRFPPCCAPTSIATAWCSRSTDASSPAPAISDRPSMTTAASISTRRRSICAGTPQRACSSCRSRRAPGRAASASWPS